jgi:vancomycin resistance protein YoaR
MLQNISRYKTKKLILPVLAALLVLSIYIFRPPSVIAADPQPVAFVIHGVDQDYNISPEDLLEWQTPKPNQNKVVYIFGPETDLNRFLLDRFGAKTSSQSKLYFDNYNIGAIYSYVSMLRTSIDSDPRDSVFEIDNSGRVTQFDPGSTGKTLDIKTSIDQIISTLSAGQTESQLVINETQPSRTLAEVNNLGIKELIASGESNFAGSPANRIHNIKVGVQKQSGVLLAPGEEFSFNKFLGEVDGAHGFLPELVIKRTGTVPEFGGGLCQVSSTVFRAAMNAGLPITERRNHSYAVQYYAPQGTDATIYPGVVDLKFKNNTENYILIWPTFPEKTKLQFSFYGTKDQRQIALGKPYQYDRKSDGSMKAVWTRTVTMPNGEALKDEFRSIYQPPALFHKEETFPNKPKPEEQPVPAVTDQNNPANSDNSSAT